MNQIIIAGQSVSRIEYKGQPVVTFKMVDELHQRPEGTARKAFNRNKEHFIENEDYFIVPYEEWSKLPCVHNMDAQRKDFIIFITQSGYLMLVKSFNDDLAWKVQRELVKYYFVIKEKIEFRRGSKEWHLRIDHHIKASQFFQKKITEGKKAGLSKKDSVLRAYTITLNETGYDFSDALPEDFKSSRFIPCKITAEKALEQFIRDCCETGNDFRIGASELYHAYKIWAAEKKYTPITLTRFGIEIKKRFDSYKTKKGVIYIGIRLKEA